MRESPSVVSASMDLQLGGVLLANMLVGWLDGDRESSFFAEAADEYHDQRATPEQDRLCVCASVDAGAGSPPSGEHGAPVCPAGESPGNGMERADGSSTGSGPGQVRSADSRTGGFQDSGSGCFDGEGWRGFCAGSIATGPLEFRLASIAGTVRSHRYAGDRRRWLLQPGRFQRWPGVDRKSG